MNAYRHRSRYRAVALVLAAALLLSGCGFFNVRPQPKPTDFFPDPGLHELAEAVRADDGERISAALTGGASPNATGTDGWTILQWAVTENSIAATGLLLEAGADPNMAGERGDTPMHAAASSTNIEHLRLLLEHGGDPNVQGEITGATPLATSLVNTNDEVFHLLLEVGADPTIANNLGAGPLHTAARTNKGWAILILLEAGADPVQADSGDRTFQDLYWSYNPEILNDRARQERRDIIAWLEARGYEVSPEAEEFREES